VVLDDNGFGHSTVNRQAGPLNYARTSEGGFQGAMDGETAPVISLAADPNPASVRPPPTGCTYAYTHTYTYGGGYPPPATAPPATAAATTTAAPTCAPSCCTPSSCAPSYCTAACAAAAPGCRTAASAASAPAAASACRKSYALAELGFVFFVEDVKRPQPNVGNFFLIESDGRTQ
jgi:hypothetical protein